MNWHSIAAFRLVTADPARLVAFYEAIGFVTEPAEPIATSELRLLGLRGTGERRRLTLGGASLDLDSFSTHGRSYPSEANAADLIFQHFALITDNARSAWDRAQAAGGTPISRDGPVTLPSSTGGVTAVKFRDPEGHSLEFLQFLARTNSHWQGSGLLGIDHSAIAVSDVEVSRRFYRQYGLAEGDATLNQGATQVALDGLDDVCVDVVPLYPPASPPHLELLGYRQPIGRPNPPLACNDIAATRIVWHAGEDALVRDPDGHLHQLTR